MTRLRPKSFKRGADGFISRFFAYRSRFASGVRRCIIVTKTVSGERKSPGFIQLRLESPRSGQIGCGQLGLQGRSVILVHRKSYVLRR